MSRSKPAGRGALVALALAALVLAGCVAYPPPDGVDAGGVGLQEVMRRSGVKPLDPSSRVPLTRQALEEIEKTDPLRQLRGRTYRLTEGNRLDPGWLLVTPEFWGARAAALHFSPPDCPGCDPDFGLPPCTPGSVCGNRRCTPLRASVRHAGERPRGFCLGHSDGYVEHIYDLVAAAEHAVDITLLAPPPDGRFLAALRNAITRLAGSGRPVVVRVLLGVHPPTTPDPQALLKALLRDAGGIPASRLRLYVGITRSCDGTGDCRGLSWNHSKIIAVDGRRALVGGHNMWTGDYLLADPVHDVSMHLGGPAARDAHRFADQLWRFVCRRPRDDPLNRAYTAAGAAQTIERGCRGEIELPDPPAGQGPVTVLSVGRLAAGIASSFADQSLIARDLMLRAATRTIRMVQQDVAFSAVEGIDRQWPQTAIETMADLLLAGGDVYIVLSNPGATGAVGAYSNGVSPELVADHIRDTAKARRSMPDGELNQLLCRHLHLAPYRFGPDDAWPDGKPFAVHAKFWMVDDRAFYIGSENLYPVELQEFGYIVEDRAAGQTVLRDYWNQVWRWSKRVAISGGDAPRCHFVAPPKS